MVSLRARIVFYGAAAAHPFVEPDRLFVPCAIRGERARGARFFVVLVGACGFVMWRVWQDQHTYGY